MAWRRPRMIFVNSMSDLFHKAVPRAFVDAVFDIDGARRLARVSGPHQAQLPPARVCQRPLHAPTRSGPHLDGGLGRGRHKAVEGPAPWRLRWRRCASCHWSPLSGRSNNSVSMASIGPLWAARAAQGARPMNPDWVRQIRKIVVVAQRGPVLLQAMGRAVRPKSGGRLLDGRRVERVSECADRIENPERPCIGHGGLEKRYR